MAKSTDPLAPFLTPDGYLDMTKLPIDSVLRNCLSQTRDEFQGGMSVLHTMAIAGREEAGVFLLGLLATSRSDDWGRRRDIVEHLDAVQTPECTDSLVGELRRVKSDNTTRQYLDAILSTLFKFPLELIEPGMQGILDDKVFSYRMHKKIEGRLDRKRFGPRRERMELEW